MSSEMGLPSTAVDGCCSWEVLRQELTLLSMILYPDQ